MSCICDKCMNFPCGEETNMIIVCCDFEEKPKVITNADRIRRMTDEELAEWIFREPTIGGFVCPPGTKDGEDCPTSPCEQCWLDWLKAPAEEVEG